MLAQNIVAQMVAPTQKGAQAAAPDHLHAILLGDSGRSRAVSGCQQMVHCFFAVASLCAPVAGAALKRLKKFRRLTLQPRLQMPGK
jgi:hypothetical protein